MRSRQLAVGIAAGLLATLLLPKTAAGSQLLPFVGYAPPAQRVKLMVHLPLRNQAEAEALAMQQSTPRSPLYRHWLTTAQFAARYAPLSSDMRTIANALHSGGLTVTNVDSQFIYANAPVATIERLFQTRMGLVRDANLLRADARTPLTLPAPLIKIGATVIGLNAFPRPQPMHLVRVKYSLPLRIHGPSLTPEQLIAGGFYPGELLQTYGEPSYTLANGAGMKIAIVGLSDSTDSDNHALWCQYGLGPGCAMNGATLAPFPTVNHFEATGSIPPDTDDNSLEAALDAQMAGGTAPGAIIDQYAADADSSTFLETDSYIVNTSHEDIITTSYGDCELNYAGRGTGPLLALHDVYLQGNLQGQTFLFSSGDSGNYACGGGIVSVSAFAVDPNVTSVGGSTELDTTSFDNGYGTAYADESSHSDSHDLWASGGGVSVIYRAPGFQNRIGVSNRGGRQVPDVSMHMGGPVSPFTFDIIVYDGSRSDVIGTSCSSPELAGTLADAATAVNASHGQPGGFRFGNFNGFLYYEQAVGNAGLVFHQDIPGDNLVTFYNPTPTSGQGYNQVVGLGTPIVAGLIAELGFAGTYQAAGDLFTASNP